MATAFTLNMNEDVLFKHPSSMKSIPGTLYFTTLRITWIASSSAHATKNILLPWTQIQDDKYSKSTDEKQRCMIRLLPVSGAALVFTLTGAPVANLRNELERAKHAVKRGRQGCSGTGDNQLVRNRPIVTKSDSSITSSQCGANSSIADDQQTAHIRTEAERREVLLSADSELRHLYTELVTGGVIDENEFWSSRSQLLSNSEGRDTASYKGISSSLLCDVQHAEVTTNGVRKFQLTPEAVMDIFQMYPHVLEEYTRKVPEQMSKDEFWVKYFQHQMYNSKHVSSQSRPFQVLSGAHPSTSSSSSSMKSTSSGESSSRNTQYIKSRQFSSEIDLTQTYGDYHSSERLDPEDTQFHPTLTSDKYKRKGNLVLEQQQQQQASFNYSSSKGHEAVASKRARVTNSVQEWETNEHILNKEKPEERDIIPLHLATKTIRQLCDDEAMPLSNSSESTSTILQNHLFALQTQKERGREGGNHLFPSAAHASAVLRREQEKLDSFTAVARQVATQEGRGGAMQVGRFQLEGDNSRNYSISSGGSSSDGRNEGMATTAGSWLMSGASQREKQSVDVGVGVGLAISSVEHMQTTPELEQFIRDQFKHVSELLIHFYVTIAHSAKVNAASFEQLSAKNQRIQNKLEERLAALQKKREWVKANASAIFPVNGKHLLTYTFKYFKEISDLIYRAFDYWEKYRSNTTAATSL